MITEDLYSVPSVPVRVLNDKQKIEFKKKKYQYLIRSLETRVKDLTNSNHEITRNLKPETHKKLLKLTEDNLVKAYKEYKEFREKHDIK